MKYPYIKYCCWKFSYNKIMNFWENVVSELEYKNIDRKELAFKARFNVSNISKGIRENNIPSADTAVKIAKALGTSVEYLVTGIQGENNDDETKEAFEQFQKYRTFFKKLEKLSDKEREAINLLVNKLIEN